MIRTWRARPAGGGGLSASGDGDRQRYARQLLRRRSGRTLDDGTWSRGSAWCKRGGDAASAASRAGRGRAGHAGGGTARVVPVVEALATRLVCQSRSTRPRPKWRATALERGSGDRQRHHRAQLGSRTRTRGCSGPGRHRADAHASGRAWMMQADPRQNRCGRGGDGVVFERPDRLSRAMGIPTPWVAIDPGIGVRQDDRA